MRPLLEEAVKEAEVTMVQVCTSLLGYMVQVCTSSLGYMVQVCTSLLGYHGAGMY